MRGDKLFWRSRRPRELRLRRPLAILRSPHILFLLALLLLAHLTVLVSATTNYTFDKQDSKHIGYWVDEKASRVTKLTLDADHYWVTSSTFQAACKVGQYFNNDCPMPTRCIKEPITTSSHDPRYKPYREVVEYDDGSRETCFNDEHPPTPFPNTPFTPSSCMPMTITLAPYYAKNTAQPDVQGPSQKYANLGCRPLYDDNNGSGWNPKNVIYATLGTAIGGATQTATATAGLKLVETRIVIQNEIPSRTRTGDNNDDNDDDDVPLLGGASIYTDENGQLQISDGPTTSTSTSTSTYTGPWASTGTIYSTTMITITYPPGHPPAHPTVTTRKVPGQGQKPGEGGDEEEMQTGLEAPDPTNTDSGSSSKFDPMETTTAAATNRTRTTAATNTATGTATNTDTATDADTPSDTPSDTPTDTNTPTPTPTTDTPTDAATPTDSPTPTDTLSDTPTDNTDPEKQEDGTTKYEKKNKKWITAAVVIGSITGGIFTCLAAWCVLSRWCIRRVLRRRSPSPSASPGELYASGNGSASAAEAGTGGSGAGGGGYSGGVILRCWCIRMVVLRWLSPSSPTGEQYDAGAGSGGGGGGGVEDGYGRRARYGFVSWVLRINRWLSPSPSSKIGQEEEGRISQDPFQDPPPWQHQGVVHNGSFEIGRDCRDCEKRSKLKRGTQLSIIDEVTEPGSKRGSGVKSPSSDIGKVEEEVEEEVKEEVRDSWPASPDRLLGSPPDDRSAGSRESGEVVNVYLEA